MKSNLHLFWPLRVLPAIVTAGRFPMHVPDCNASYSHPTIALHLHDYPADLWIQSRRFRLEPGDLTISRPETLSRYNLHESGTHLCVHFEPPEKEAAQARLQLPLHFRLGSQTVSARERFWRLIDYARQANGKSDSPSGCAASAVLQEFLLWLYSQTRRGAAPRQGNRAEEALTRLKQAMEKSLTKPMLIEELAAGVGLSSAYVARLFAQRHGMTLQHYLLQRRIELARHLLLTSDLRISEVGCRVGLPDPQYFNKQFRRVTGQSPLAFRQQARKSNRRLS